MQENQPLPKVNEYWRGFLSATNLVLSPHILINEKTEKKENIISQLRTENETEKGSNEAASASLTNFLESLNTMFSSKKV